MCVYLSSGWPKHGQPGLATLLLFFYMASRVPFSGGRSGVCVENSGQSWKGLQPCQYPLSQGCFSSSDLTGPSFPSLVDPRVVVMGTGLLVSSRKFVTPIVWIVMPRLWGSPKDHLGDQILYVKVKSLYFWTSVWTTHWHVQRASSSLPVGFL